MSNYLLEAIDWTMAPNGLGESLRMYAEHGVPTGGFLRAVLSNDLIGACARADLENRRRLHEIVAWVDNNLPTGIRGSKAAFDAHVERHRRLRIGECKE